MKDFDKDDQNQTKDKTITNWSVFGFVHSKSRNRLYGHKVEKLVYIFQNMRLLRKIRYQAFREPRVLPDHMFDEDEEEEE